MSLFNWCSLFDKAWLLVTSRLWNCYVASSNPGELVHPTFTNFLVWAYGGQDITKSCSVTWFWTWITSDTGSIPSTWSSKRNSVLPVLLLLVLESKMLELKPQRLGAAVLEPHEFLGCEWGTSFLGWGFFFSFPPLFSENITRFVF